MKNKHAVFPITMAGLAFLCFLFIAFCISTCVQPLWGKTMVLTLPSLILAVVAILAVKGRLDRRMTEFMTIVLSIILAIASSAYMVLLIIWTAMTVTTDLEYYERAYDVVNDRLDVEGIFPEKIPTDAENVTFHYSPQFLQGGEMLELSYTTTNEVLRDWEILLREQSEWVGSNEEWRRKHWGYGDMEAVRYQLYLEDGNHGETAFVLINPVSNRITFCFDHW